MPTRFSLRRNSAPAARAPIPPIAPPGVDDVEGETTRYEAAPYQADTVEEAAYDGDVDEDTTAAADAYEEARQDGDVYNHDVYDGESYEGDAYEGDVYEGHAGGVYAPVYPGGPGDFGTEGTDLDDESWLVPDTRRRVKVAIPTFLLALLVVVAGAFWGGAVVDKHFGTHTAATGAGAGAGRFAAAGAGGFAGFGGAEGAGTGATGFAGAEGFGAGGFTRGTPTAEGTLSAVSGDDLTVTPTTGAKVKVVMNSSTVVTRSGKGAPGALSVGDTVRVVGTKASNGTVTATSITATAAGVTATGGFGGLGAAGAGATGTGATGTGATGSGFSGDGSGVSGASSTGASSSSTVANGGFSGDGSGVSGG